MLWDVLKLNLQYGSGWLYHGGQHSTTLFVEIPLLWPYVLVKPTSNHSATIRYLEFDNRRSQRCVMWSEWWKCRKFKCKRCYPGSTWPRSKIDVGIISNLWNKSLIWFGQFVSVHILSLNQKPSYFLDISIGYRQRAARWSAPCRAWKCRKWFEKCPSWRSEVWGHGGKWWIHATFKTPSTYPVAGFIVWIYLNWLLFFLQGVETTTMNRTRTDQPGP